MNNREVNEWNKKEKPKKKRGFLCRGLKLSGFTTVGALKLWERRLDLGPLRLIRLRIMTLLSFNFLQVKVYAGTFARSPDATTK